MARYGNIHALSDFVSILLSKRGGKHDLTFAHLVLTGLKRLDAVQQANQFVTLSVSTGGGIWVTHAGLRNFMIIPTQHSLRIIADKPGGLLASTLDEAARLPSAVKNTTSALPYLQWNVFADGLESLWRFVEALPRPNADEIKRHIKERRNFPGPIRQAALEDFQRDGSVCPGVSVPGKEQRPHKLKPADRIEFDHILPHAFRGSRGHMNIQVLCASCNRLKSATAY